MATEKEKGDRLYIDRVLDLMSILEKKSLFLLGPRQTGKTSLIQHTLKDAKIYDLLDTSVFLSMNQNPGPYCSMKCTGSLRKAASVSCLQVQVPESSGAAE